MAMGLWKFVWNSIRGGCQGATSVAVLPGAAGQPVHKVRCSGSKVCKHATTLTLFHLPQKISVNMQVLCSNLLLSDWKGKIPCTSGICKSSNVASLASGTLAIWQCDHYSKSLCLNCLRRARGSGSEHVATPSIDTVRLLHGPLLVNQTLPIPTMASGSSSQLIWLPKMVDAFALYNFNLFTY